MSISLPSAIIVVYHKVLPHHRALWTASVGERGIESGLRHAPNRYNTALLKNYLRGRPRLIL